MGVGPSVAAAPDEEVEFKFEIAGDGNGDVGVDVERRLMAPLSRNPACRPQRKRSCACSSDAVRTWRIWIYHS